MSWARSKVILHAALSRVHIYLSEPFRRSPTTHMLALSSMDPFRNVFNEHNTSSEQGQYQAQPSVRASGDFSGLNTTSSSLSGWTTTDALPDVPAPRQYVDHSKDPILNLAYFESTHHKEREETRPASSDNQDDETSVSRGKSEEPQHTFPRILYEMLDRTSQNHNENVVSWRSHGRCFYVYDRVAFEKGIMPQ